jgi:hypothetical protein
MFCWAHLRDWQVVLRAMWRYGSLMCCPVAECSMHDNIFATSWRPVRDGRACCHTGRRLEGGWSFEGLRPWREKFYRYLKSRAPSDQKESVRVWESRMARQTRSLCSGNLFVNRTMVGSSQNDPRQSCLGGWQGLAMDMHT